MITSRLSRYVLSGVFSRVRFLFGFPGVGFFRAFFVFLPFFGGRFRAFSARYAGAFFPGVFFLGFRGLLVKILGSGCMADPRSTKPRRYLFDLTLILT